MGFKRDIFTGELVEFESSETGRELIYQEEIAPSMQQGRRAGSAWSKPLVSQAMSVHPEQYKEFNESAKRYGTGAFYDKNGDCHLPTRSARNKEMKRRRMFDKSGGYGDYCGK